MGSAPLLASWLVGRFLWRRLTRSRRDLPADSWSAALLTGAVCLQLLTWVGALFSPPFMRVLQVAVIAAGAIALAVLVRPRSRPDAPACLAMPEDPLASAAALLGLASGFFLAGTYIPNSIPADAIAYHVPISEWFARGGAWPRLPQHTWNAQWPLASSLWSSFGLAAKDRLVVWSAQNYAFLAWTAAVVFDVVRSIRLFGSGRRRTLVAGGLALTLLVGAYSGYQSLGFVDYRFGLFAAALAGVLLRMPLTWSTVPVALALASCPAEFRPQGLLLTVAILVWWAGFQALGPGRSDPTDGRRSPIAIALAGVLFAKWWLLVWMRWGTPAPPLFARWWNLRETEQYADEVFHYLWASDPGSGLDLLFLGAADTWPLTILVWGLLLLVALAGARVLRESPRPDLAAYRRMFMLALMLAPVAACAYVATQVPSEAPRMIAPILPAMLMMLAAVVAALPTSPRMVAGLLFLFAFITASLSTAPLPWRRPHAGAAYVSSTTFAFDRVERELAGLHAERPLVFNQYIPFLPDEFRQMGVTYGPWATFPRVPLRTQQAWMRWLNENGIRTLVVERGKALENTWEWAGDRPTTPDFRVLDRWIAECPGRRIVGQWIACPVPTGFETPGSDRQKKRE
jgi:hypothetical protein